MSVVIGNDGMEKLIPIINELQDACTQTGLTLQLDLPQIVVVGSQSAGKSSVLENFVGRDFLPRGSGIVTRCPLILQLTNADKEYGQFLHRPEFYEDFDQIRTEIQAETNRKTGTNKGITKEPINLRIFSPHVLDVTIVDLPGLTKVPIGDQPADIEAKTESMILEYIRKENCLILAVTPANIDLANSDALKLAKEVDPEGVRTIGVITKLDLMDKGTDALGVLENRVFPLQRGYVGVVNRSQEDIDGKKDIQTARQKEIDFFVEHPSYNHMADRCGTSYLQHVLNRELTEHIYKLMPNLEEELQKKITSFDGDIEKFKGVHLADVNEMKQMILRVVQQLACDFKNEIGAFGQESVEIDELSSGAKINRIFHERLAKEIEKIKFEEKKTLEEIDRTIRNINGIRCGLYSPQMAFEKFTEKQIEKMKAPIALIINLVIEDLTKAVRKCVQKTIYPSLRDFLKKTIIEYINTKIVEPAKRDILTLIDIEMSYINTNNMIFEDSDEEVDGAAGARDGEEENPLHEGAWDIYEKLTLYMGNVKKNMTDQVPKAVTYYIIKKLVHYINHDVILTSMELPRDDFKKLLKLDGIEEAKYLALVKMREACTKALSAIRELSEQTDAIRV